MLERGDRVYICVLCAQIRGRALGSVGRHAALSKMLCRGGVENGNGNGGGARLDLPPQHRTTELPTVARRLFITRFADVGIDCP